MYSHMVLHTDNEVFPYILLHLSCYSCDKTQYGSASRVEEPNHSGYVDCFICFLHSHNM